MNTLERIARVSFATLVVAGTTVWVAGCKNDKGATASTAQVDSAGTPTAVPAPPVKPISLAQIKQDLIEAKAQVQSTTDALNKLQASSTTDAVANYNAYSEQYTKLKAKAEITRARAADLKKRGTEYLAMWDKQAQVQNPTLRSQAMTQKAEASTLLNTIANEMEMTRIEFAPYMANLTDVGDYLHDNVTPGNLQTTADLVAKAGDQSKNVNGHIDNIITALDKMAVALGESSGPIQAAPASSVQPPANSNPGDSVK